MVCVRSQRAQESSLGIRACESGEDSLKGLATLHYRHGTLPEDAGPL